VRALAATAATAASAAALVAGALSLAAAPSDAAVMPPSPLPLPISLPIGGVGTIPVLPVAGSPTPTLVSLGSKTATTIGATVLTVHPADPAAGEPDAGLSLRLARLRSGGRSFEVRGVRCVGGANRVVYTVGGVRRVGPCGGRPAIISGALVSGRLYNLDIEAVRMSDDRVASGGVVHTGTIEIGPVHRGWAVTA